MRFFLAFITASLLFSLPPQAPAEEEQQQVSKEFTKTYRAYNAAYAQRNFPRAAELARKALDLGVRELGAEHEKIAVLRLNLSHVLLDVKNYEEAEPLLAQARDALVKRLGADHVDLILVHENYARIHLAKKEPAKAHQELDRIIAIIAADKGEDAAPIADVLLQQAALNLAEKKLEEAETLYGRALTIYEKSLGEDSLRAADVIGLLGDIDLARQDYEKAEEKYARALAIYEDNLLEDDPVVLAGHSRLAKLYVLRRDDKFARHADKFIQHSPAKEGAAVPLFIMQPRYPIFKDGVKPAGWALVEFSVTAEGRVLNPRIIESRPGKLFDKVSLEVAPQWRFKPKVVEGKRVPQEKTRVRLVYARDNIEVYYGELKL